MNLKYKHFKKRKIIKNKIFKKIFLFKVFFIFKKKYLNLIFFLQKKLNFKKKLNLKQKINYNNIVNGFFNFNNSYHEIKFFNKIYRRLLLKLNFNFDHYYYFVKKFYHIVKTLRFTLNIFISKVFKVKKFLSTSKIFLSFKFKSLINKLFLIKNKKFFSSIYKRKTLFLFNTFKRNKKVRSFFNPIYSYPFFFFSNFEKKKKIDFFEILNFFDNKKYIFYYQKNSIFQKIIKNIMTVFLKRKININFYNENRKKIYFLFSDFFEKKYVCGRFSKFLNKKKNLKKIIYKKKIKKNYLFSLRFKFLKKLGINSLLKLKINSIFFMTNFYKYFFLIFNKNMFLNNFSVLLVSNNLSYFNIFNSDFKFKSIFLNKNYLSLLKEKLYSVKKIETYNFFNNNNFSINFFEKKISFYNTLSYREYYKNLNQLKINFKNLINLTNFKNKFFYIKNNFKSFSLKKNNMVINSIVFLKFFKKYLKNISYYKQNNYIFNNINDFKTKIEQYIIKKKSKIKYFYKRWRKNYFIKKSFSNLFFVPKKGYLIIKVEQKNKIVRSLIKGFIKQARGRRLFKYLRPRIVKLKKFCFTRSKKTKARRK